MFGDVGGTPIGGGGTLDASGVLKYDLDGNLLASLSFGEFSLGLFGTGSLCGYHNGRLYTTYSS